MQKLKKPVSILLVFMMIVSLFAAVPMTVNAAPPGGGGGIDIGGGGTNVDPITVDTKGSEFATAPTAISGLVANGTDQELINGGTTSTGTAYYYMTTEDITGDQANSLFNNPSKPGSFSTEIPKGRDAGTYYIWFAIDGGENYADFLPYMEINNQYESHKLTVTIAAPTEAPTPANPQAGDVLPESEYLTFTAEEAGSSVTMDVESGSDLQYNKNNSGWASYTAGTEIALENVGDSVSFSGKDVTFDSGSNVMIDGKVACSGNVMSLRLSDGVIQGLSESCFDSMFMNCTGLTTAPELPETALAPYCYYYMFYGCESLTAAPELPATTLEEGCYSNMFEGCTSLTAAPELPATTLADSCYYSMFASCESLSAAPELPATTLAYNCYNYMFSGCKKLTTAPELPATTLEGNCYNCMFSGCESLSELPELPATTLAPMCYYMMFSYCPKIYISDEAGTFDGITYSVEYRIPSSGTAGSAMYALNDMFSSTGGKFKGTPNINTTYYIPAKKYTVTDESVNGTVTASVNDTDVTEAAQDDAVLLNVAPAEGYQFKSITATCAKNGVEDFSDLVALMGDAVADGCDGEFDGYTFKVEDGEFVIYNGSTLFAELSESDVSDFQVGDEIYAESGYGDEGWYFTLSDNKITGFYWESYLTGDYFFTNEFESTGTLLPVELALTTVTEGSQYSFTMPNKPVTVTAEFEAIPTYTVTWKNGDTVLETDTDVAEGTTPTYDGETPTKPEDENYTYTFSGWTPEITAVTGDATYTAQYTATFKGITSDALYEGLVIDAGTPIKFLMMSTNQIYQGIELEVYLDDVQVKSLKVTPGSPTEPDRYYTPTKKCIVDSYTVQRGQTSIHTLYLKSLYDVTWKNDDGTTLKTDNDVAFDTTPTYDGETPYKADGADCIYTFSGWTPAVAPVTGDVTYTAQFTESEKPETIKDCNNKYGNFRLYSNVPIVQFSNSDALLTGAIIPITYGDGNTMVPLVDAKGYSYKFYDQTGTEIPAQITDSSSAPGSNYEFSDDVTVYTNVINFTRPAGCTAIYIVATEPAPAPAPAKLILNVGENGKVVMDNGTFGNATDANNIVEVHAPINVADGSKIFIADDHTANLLEGGSINIATGGEVSFYPSADNTGEITAIPDEDYAFIGWYNGDTLYSSDAALSYQSISEDITLTAKFERELFWKHSVTLGGDIGVNFYLNPAVLDTYTGDKTVTFTWDGNETTVDVPATATADGYKVTCNVVAAQMAHKIHAVVKADGTALAQTDDYSVQDYAETVFKNPEKYDSEKPDELRALAKAMLNYGAMAQTVFYDSLKEHPALANTVVGNNGYEGVTADQIEGAIKGSAFTVSDVETALGAKFYTSSLIYLSRNTLRIYFTPTSYPGEIPNAGAYDGNLSGYYYYVDAANIPAAELDNQQTFNVNGTTFTFSALDYAKAVVESTKMEPEQQNLAKALYLYNMTANGYFDDAPAPVENVVDLSTLEGNYEAQNNDVLTGILSGNKKITIADGATVTLRNVDITCLTNDYNALFAGITPLGDATIMLEGANTVKGGYEDYPGICVPENKTLTIDGTGSLDASSNGYGCGIGGGNAEDAGNIIINGGTIIATGGVGAAGIGVGSAAQCGDITINGGTVTAIGGEDAAAIGSGGHATCGDITIAGTVTQVTATKGEYAPNSIGAGDGGTCGTVTIGGVEGAISTSPYTYQP